MSETSAAFRTAEVRGIGMRDGEIRCRSPAVAIDTSAIAAAAGVGMSGAAATCAPLSSALTA